VFGGTGLHLGAIEGYMAQAHHPGLLAQPQDLNEQAFEGIKVAAPEFTDTAVIRLLITGQHAERKILVAGTLDLAGGDGAHAVGVEQKHRQPLRGSLRLHPRIKALLPAGIFGLSRDEDGR
jgi:hypothetical protein